MSEVVRNPGDRINRVITSVPIDQVAARVTSRGTSYERDFNGHDERCGYSHTPPAMREPANDLQRQLIGIRRGRMLVVGVSAATRKEKSRYVVRCDCSMYEFRTAKAIRNPNNVDDCCIRCRHIKYLKERRVGE